MGEGKAKREKGRKERRSLRRAKEDGGKGVAEELGEKGTTQNEQKKETRKWEERWGGGQGGEGRRETAQFGQEPEQEGTKPGPHYQFS